MEHNLSVYNSLTKKKEQFIPLQSPQVKMYCCGPTVYDFLHVGNFRGAIFYNFLRHWLSHLGYQVTMVYNYTDVDDRIIKRANDESVDSLVISERYIQEFEKDFKNLGLEKHTHNPRVTEHMPQIVSLVEALIANKKAYVVNGEVLYSISSFTDYGKLSGRNPEELQAGARVEVDEKKQNPLDFALWKPSKPGEPSWDSPWGKGRPGWHIECSAMVKSLLGDQIDIHGGGSDLIFPHHENEIAQSEGCTGHTYSKYWIHNNMFTFSGQKMSKSIGNVLKARDFLEQYHPEIFKYMVMSVHYRSLAEFSIQTADYAISALGRIYSALSVAEHYLNDINSGENKLNGSQQLNSGDSISQIKLEPSVQTEMNLELAKKTNPKYDTYLTTLWTQVEKAFNDDFSTPEAFSQLFELVRDFNGKVKRGMKKTNQVEAICFLFKNWVTQFGSLMSLFQEIPDTFLRDIDDRLLQNKKLERSHIDALVANRQAARAQKDFAKSDELRKELTDLGISVSDTPEGSFWEVTK